MAAHWVAASMSSGGFVLAFCENVFYEGLCNLFWHVCWKRLRTTRVGGSKVCASACQLVAMNSIRFISTCDILFNSVDSSTHLTSSLDSGNRASN